MNYILITSLAAILITQLLKYPIAHLFYRKSVNLNLITSTGGMPSSHSAAVTSLIASLIFEYGFESPLVAIATVFGVIIMFDSMGVRRQSGEQGIVLDILARKHLKDTDLERDDIQDSASNPFLLEHNINAYEQMIIKRYLGHKPTEVIGGIISGTIISVIARWFYITVLY